VGSKKSVQLAPEIVDSVEAFVELFVTEGRLRQGWEELCADGRRVDITRIADFTQWISKDVEKESGAELQGSNLSWSQVSGQVALRARKWFITQLNLMGGVDVVCDDASFLAAKPTDAEKGKEKETEKESEKTERGRGKRRGRGK
jgi:hypothetical protein